MKFTDGYWSLRKGITARYPVQVWEVETGSDSLTVYAPTKPIARRGDTINHALLALEFSSPMADVIRVRLTRHLGGKPASPEFALIEQPPARVKAAAEEAAAAFSSGRLSVRIPRAGEWRMEFLADGRPLTASGRKGMALFETQDAGCYLREQLNLGIGENVYGLGERFTPFVKNGQAVDIWNSDGGTGSEQAYKNIPFYLTNRGYGVFVNHPGRVSFEVGSERSTGVNFSVAGEALEYFLIYGPTPKEVLEKYTALTGRPAIPPAWSFGLWLSTSFTTKYDEETVTRFIQGMADRDLPLSVFHFDCFWMKEYRWCDFEWDRGQFPDPAGLLSHLKARGLHISLWINPYISQRSDLFAGAAKNGYLLRKPNGDVWQTDLWQPGMGIVDFTNPAAAMWFGDRLRALLDMGVDCFKTDFGESIPTDVVYHDGSDPVRMHNYYSYLYNRTVFDVLRERRGEGEAVVFARSGTSGSQQYPVHWGGDCESTFEAMAESLRGGLSLGLSGFGFWSHDIGGFIGTPTAVLYKRWIAFGLLSSHSRLHGEDSYRVPWLFDEEAVDVLRHFTKLKNRLMPYLFAHALEAGQKGIPLMRAMMLEHPGDPACDCLDRQYMLGPSLLVAPVFSEEGAVSYYLPCGRWTNFLTGVTADGPRWVEESHGCLSVPLWVRPGTLLAVGREEGKPDYDYADGPVLQAYQLPEGEPVSAVVPSISGAEETRFEVKREGCTVSATKNGPAKGWKLLLVGLKAVASVKGGTAGLHPLGTLIAAGGGGDSLFCALEE
ncbi:MAG: alpha-xylosidase [Anaerolineales bacterium]|nr:alpha-xylosidase [Anaerolineales bacterium]